MKAPKSVARRGTLETTEDSAGRRYYRGKVRLRDGTLARIPIPDAYAYSEPRAREVVAAAQEAEDETHAIFNAKTGKKTRDEAHVAGAAGETCDAWYARFSEFRQGKASTVDGDRGSWRKWVSPHIGSKPMRSITADDIENVRDGLTAAVFAYERAGNVKADGRLAPKTAQNIWAAVTTPFKFASTRKGPRELRVREAEGNPCVGIDPPRDGASKKRNWLRPAEVLAVVSAKVVPREWREAIAIGCYLHLRPGELHELRVKDLDLDAGEVRISRAYDEREKVVKSPKTEEGVRTVTIPPTLMPLLERIAREGGPESRVAPVVEATEEYYRPNLFRSYLEAAGVTTRPELYVETATHIMIDFRSLRDSGITWRFLADHKAETVQREAGHERVETTLGYAKEVENRGGRFGKPFPTLPSELVNRRGKAVSVVHPADHQPAKLAKLLLRLQDSNLRPGG